MSDHLSSVRAKTKRAKEHIINLEIAVRSFLDDTDANKVGTKPDPKTGKPIPYVAGIDTTPHSIVLTVGDAVHNLKSALDHLAYQLYLVGPESASGRDRKIYFPFADSAAEYKPGFHRKIQVMSNEAIEVLKSIEAYKGGKGHSLWVLNELDNTDKHRLLVTTGVRAFHLARLGFSESPISISQPRGMIHVYSATGPYSKPASGDFPLKVGDELFGADAEVDEKMKIRFEIALAEPEIIQGEPVLPFLHQLVDVVNGVVNEFATFL